MYCTRKISNDLISIGVDDRRLAMFEGVYSVPNGVSYNSYLLLDEKTVLFDTVDKAVGKVFFENLASALGERKLDYVVVQHIEPDHSATLSELMLRYPGTTIVCNVKSEAMIENFFGLNAQKLVVKEGDSLTTGTHTLKFFMAPMVHWPEVMVTFDEKDKTLFSADAFGTFGTLNGALFADEVDFDRDYMGEARRYYTNIVGKYGPQVQTLLKKTEPLGIKMICPLHGFVWRKDLNKIVEKYKKWSAYEPEEYGVAIIYASVYGNTENAANIVAARLFEKGVKTVMFDVSVAPSSEIVAAAFKYSHLVFASTTYNAGIFVTMEDVMRELIGHNIQNRTVAFIENGSWAPLSGKLMRELFAASKNISILENGLTIKSALKASQQGEIDLLISAIADSVPQKSGSKSGIEQAEVDPKTFFKLSYGLFVLTAREGEKDNGCIINTAGQVTSSPNRISIALNKQNYTHGMIERTGKFNVSVLGEDTSFAVFQNFGFKSGKDTDKFEGAEEKRTQNGLRFVEGNAVFSAEVIEAVDCGTHTIFVADVTEAKVLSPVPSVTYAYYFAHIKPKPAAVNPAAKGKVWVCKICGYVYDDDKEGIPFEKLADDWVCPLCKHPKSDFELQK